MTRYVLLARTYPPFSSPSGGVVRIVAQEMARTHDVDVVAWTGDEGLAEAPPLSERMHWMREERPGWWVRPANRVRRAFGWQPSQRRSRTLARTLADLDLHPDDVVVACTPEEALMLDRVAGQIGTRHRLLMLERLLRPSPRVRRLPLLGRWADSIVTGREAAVVRRAERTVALPVVAAGLRERGTEGSIADVEHPMLRDLTQLGRVARSGSSRLVYAGALDRTNRNPTPVLKILDAAHHRTGLIADFYTYGNCQHLLEEPFRSTYLASHGVVPPAVAEGALAAADIILTIGNRDPGVVPSKIFDCISTGRPIVHFYQHDDDPYLAYLVRYPYALTLRVDAAVDESARRLSEAVEGWIGVRALWSDIATAYPECLPGHAVQQLVLP